MSAVHDNSTIDLLALSEMCCLSGPAAMHIWQTITDAGHDPVKLFRKCKEASRD